jgi:hypothetical protein
MASLTVIYAVWRFGPPSPKLPAVYAMFLLPVVVAVVRLRCDGRTTAARSADENVR